MAQYRCRKIPYDCNQNGFLDTLEFDGIALNGNADGLLDVDNDRVPDGCFPRTCYESPNNTGTGDALLGFVPVGTGFPENPVDPERLFGNGGTLPDNGIFVSDLRGVPERNDPQDIYWAYEPTEIRIEGMVHPQFTQMEIELVREDVYGEEQIWSVLNCTDLQGQSGVSNTLAGTYVFNLSARPADVNSFPAATTLSGRDLCTVASSGEYGNLIPGGVYRPTSDLVDFKSTPFNDRWFLRFTDTAIGGAGFFSGWSLKMTVLPYQQDCNSDGIPDRCVDAFSFDSDCNLNGVADSCEIVSAPSGNSIDCDLNGVIDDCEDTSFLLDLGGGVWDADGESLGTDEANEAADTAYIIVTLGCADFNPDNICTPNCRPDLCDIIADSNLDANNNFILDCIEGENVLCQSRSYNSSDKGTTGVGMDITDLTIVESTIEVLAEVEDDPVYEAVLDGATVLGNIKLSIHDLKHGRLGDVQISLLHRSPSGLRVTDLLLFGCEGTGYLADPDISPTTYKFSANADSTLCEAADQGSVIPPTVFYLPVDGSFSDHIGASAVGTWTLQIFDGVFGQTGSFSSWDLEFVHRPPDFNNNGTPDVCE